MISPRAAGIKFPYVEGLRMDEAMHPLALLTVGLYGETLPNQNGAPLRLVLPWKYGFKSIKSIVKVTLTEKEPVTTWAREWRRLTASIPTSIPSGTIRVSARPRSIAWAAAGSTICKNPDVQRLYGSGRIVHRDGLDRNY